MKPYTPLRHMSRKVSDAHISFKDGPRGGYVRWKVIWLGTDTTAEASEWLPDNPGNRKWVEDMIRVINGARKWSHG